MQSLIKLKKISCKQSKIGKWELKFIRQMILPLPIPDTF